MKIWSKIEKQKTSLQHILVDLANAFDPKGIDKKPSEDYNFKKKHNFMDFDSFGQILDSDITGIGTI